MREIKFRGQMTTGEWVYGLPHLDLPGSTAYFNECSYRICWSPETGGSANAPIKNGTLGQYTGLKDKNGKEIYEVDIVTGWKRGSNSDRGYIGIIEWQTEQAGWVIKCNKYIVEILSLAMSGDGINTTLDSFEVIGNLYETPELINKL